MRNHFVPIVALAGILVGCCSQNLPNPTAAERVRAQCPPPSSTDYFYVAGMFAPEKERDELYRSGPSLLLRSINEPSLSCGDGEDSYRFLWSSAVASSALIIRVVHKGGVWSALGVRMASLVDRRPSVKNETTLSQQQVDRLFETLEAAKFWTVPNYTRDPGISDGDAWIFEGRRDDGYHSIRRWNLRTGPLRELGLTFVKCAGVPVPPEIQDASEAR
jgi:hypothetical protein